MDGGALADDFFVVVFGAVFFLQIGIFHFQTLFQGLHFVECGVQLFFRQFAFADVAENHHRADQTAIVDNRRTGVFHRNGFTVLAPEEFVFDMTHFAVAKSGVDVAVLTFVLAAVAVAVVNHGVHVLAVQFVGLPARMRSAAGLTKVVSPLASTP